MTVAGLDVVAYGRVFAGAALDPGTQQLVGHVGELSPKLLNSSAGAG